MEITLDEIIEFTDSNGYEIIDEAWNGILYRGSDGEEVYEDEIIEMIEEKKKELSTLQAQADAVSKPLRSLVEILNKYKK